MSIASELQNYADGLDNAYDAAQDMGATIPVDRNMDNLDDAIRTIPVSSPNDGVLTIQQNGTTLGTFSADQATNTTVNVTTPVVTTFYGEYLWGGSSSYTLYKDPNMSQAATFKEIYDSFGDNKIVKVKYSDDESCSDYESIMVPTYENDSCGSSIDDGDVLYISALQDFGYKGDSNVGVAFKRFTPDTTVANYPNAQSSFTITDTYTQVAIGELYLHKDISQQYALYPAYGGSMITHDEVYDGIVNKRIYYTIDDTKNSFDLASVKGIIVSCSGPNSKIIVYAKKNSSSDTIEFWKLTPYASPDTRHWNLEQIGTTAPFTGATSSVAGSSGMVPAPTTSDPDKFLKGDGTWGTPTGTTYTAGTNVSIDAQNVISATDTTYSDFTGATASVAGAHGLVPAPAAGDEAKALHGDGTWKDTTAKLVEMAYGEANAWAKFIAAYNAGSIVYCRASSNADPSSGAKTRKAFMAYVNNETNPTSVEFQYVRSVSSKTDSQQCDQVFVYTLKNTSGGQWSVASRNMGPKINVSGPITKTFTNGANATITIGADAMTGATSSTAGAAGVVPKPNSGDQDKVLTGAGTWANVTGPNMDFSSAAGTAVIKTVTDALDRTGIYFADGTLITTRKVQYVGPINTSWGSLYEGHTNDYYKFAPTGGDDFVAEPNVQVTIFNNSASGSCWLGAWENSPQIVSGGWAIPAGALCFIRASAFPTDVTLNLYIQAIGRWK